MDNIEYSVSVVVPIYNSMEYLEECLASLFNQTLKSLEIICVDDGSTDTSFKYLASLQREHLNLVVISKPNKGYGHSMNIGMGAAHGEYIGILESDDYADCKMFEDLYTTAKKYNLDMVKSDFTRFYRNFGIETSEDNLICKKNLGWYNKIWNPSKQPELLDVSMNTWTGIYRTEFIRHNKISHNETPGASYQDNGFWFKTFYYARRAMFLNKVYYHLRRDNPNSSVNNRGKVFCMCDEYAHIYEFLKQDNSTFSDFIGMYHKRKYYNYMFNMDRVAYEFKTEFAEKMSEEYKEAITRHEFDPSLFSANELETLYALLSNPTDFVKSRYSESEISKFNPKIIADLIEKSPQNAKQYCFDHKDNPLSDAWLGRIYRDGVGVQKDLDAAILYYTVGYKAEVRWVYKELIDILLKRNLPGDKEEAFEIAKNTANDSKEMAGICGRLGRMYRDGVGTSVNLDLAVLWMKKASDNGLKWACVELVDMLLHRGKVGDFEFAFNLASTNVDTSSDSAGLYGRLGRMYRDGLGVEVDLDKAIYWMKRASNHNITFAHKELTDLLLKRIACDQNSLFDLCVSNACVDKNKAIFAGRLARLYRDGVGTKKNISEAIKWMKIASDNGLSWAHIEYVDLLLTRKSDEDCRIAFEVAR